MGRAWSLQDPQAWNSVKAVFWKVPLRFHPGDSYAYGFSTDVLGRVVEIISRKTLEDFLHPALQGTQFREVEDLGGSKCGAYSWGLSFMFDVYLEA